MKITITEYDRMKDSVSFLYTEGTNTFEKDCDLVSLDKILVQFSKGSLVAKDEDYEFFKELVKKGGVDWVKEEVNNNIEL